MRTQSVRKLRPAVRPTLDLLLDDCRLEVSLVEGAIIKARRFDFKARTWTDATGEVLASEYWAYEIHRALINFSHQD